MNELLQQNPTESLNLDLSNWLKTRERKFGQHMIGGVPDYSFAMDRILRQKLERVRIYRSFIKKILATAVPIIKQEKLMNAARVSPRQFPRVFEMAEQCARMLGIGVPEVFVEFDPMINAYTVATDDVEPIIVVTHTLVDALTDDELLFVMGHESGHIHNLHGVYQTAAVLLASPIINQLGWISGMVFHALGLALNHWSRAAEVTSDRAGLICGGNLDAALSALAKLTVGSPRGMEGIDTEELQRQQERVEQGGMKYLELMFSHPIISKRIEALRVFAPSDVYQSWRPEAKGLEAPLPFAEVESRCADIISVLGKTSRKAVTGGSDAGK